MKISAKGRYGLAAMTYLARNYASGSPVTIVSISEKLGISKIYLEQVFSLLKRARLVNSIKGSQGGYQLSRAPREITPYRRPGEDAGTRPRTRRLRLHSARRSHPEDALLCLARRHPHGHRQREIDREPHVFHLIDSIIASKCGRTLTISGFCRFFQAKMCLFRNNFYRKRSLYGINSIK